MKILHRTFAITVLAFCASHVSAQQLPAKRGVVTLGDPDCTRWVKETRDSDRFWLTGYLSGLNAMYPLLDQSQADPLRQVKSDQAVMWIDNYCKANPLRTVNYAAQKLFWELVNQK